MRRIAPLLFLAACTEPSALDSRGAPAVTPVAVDPTGAPRLLQGSNKPLPAATPTDSAKRHLAAIAPAYHVPAGALPELRGLGEIAVRGGTIARIEQRIDGLPVEDGELRLLVRPGGELATVGGTLIGTHTPRSSQVFASEVADEAGAIAHAMRHLYGAAFDRAALGHRSPAVAGRDALLGGTSGDVHVSLARAHRAWHRSGSGSRLIAAWVVEAYSSRGATTSGDATRTVIDGAGRVLAHRSLVADASFQYRVFADTTGEKHPFDGPTADATPHPSGTPDGSFPPYVAPRLVTVDSLNTTNDPWLAAGATETLGNNVDAYVDVNGPDGLTNGDFRASVSGAGVFDRVYNTAAEPLANQTQQMAAVTSLFYNLNWLHDFWYDHGFTEAAGNGQASNLGRGGVEGDPILGEAQDNALGGSRNNANMSTPSDGLSPRMQVFLWSGADERSMAVANRTPAVNTASFGPDSFDITAQVVIAADGTGTTTDACEPITNNVTGRIVLVDRGSCSFKSKALRVQQAGGVGMILADNNAANATPPTMGGDNTITQTITIGSLSVTLAEGTAIKNNVNAGATNATLHRLAGVELEGALDSTLIAHEFGHYLHHRLQSCGTKMCGALSEGWGDFLALMSTVRQGDNLDGAYPFSIYTTQGFGADAGYFGIRRAPYSVNQNINALSFRHMAEGEATPNNHPFRNLNNNSEVHNAGEIWAQAMFEGYIALQKAGPTFAEARAKMADYVVAGLLLAPPDGTPTETRDAILAAAFAASPADHDLLIAAFARRGMGSCAVSPPRESTDFTGIVESVAVNGRALPGETMLVESESCDADGVLDAGETATIKVPVENPGHGQVTDVAVTVTSATPGVTVVGGTAAIGTMAPYTSTEIEVEVRLDPSVRGALAGDIELGVAATGGCEPTVTRTVHVRMNTDEVPASSATDSMDALSTSWTPVTTGEPGWSQQFGDGLDGFWHGADLGVLADTALESPVLTADAAQPLVVTFTHRYAFEFSDGTAFDGAVIEVTTDGGATWTDVTDLGVDPGYSADVITTDSGNPLGGRNGFTGESPGYPSTSEVTLDFGTQLAGKDFQLRFRIGTDQAAGAEGWEIDDVAFSGIVGTPFATVVPDAGTCSDNPPGGDGGGCCDAGPLRASNGLVALGLGALLLRRRRRRA